MFGLAALMSSQGSARTFDMLNVYNVRPYVVGLYSGCERKVIGSSEALLER